MLSGEHLVAGSNDQIMLMAGQPFASVVRFRRRLLEDNIGGNRFSRDQVTADAEMLQRALSLRAPELLGGHNDITQAITTDEPPRPIKRKRSTDF
jgi:hypothetical protein